MRRLTRTTVALSLALLATTAPAAAGTSSSGAATPDCHPPITDPASLQYVELGVIEVYGATYGPRLPTCGDDVGPTPTDYLALCIPEVIGVDIPCPDMPPQGR